MARSLLYIPWRMVKAVVLTALIGLVLFFAATRTQVGRNELRQEVERQFADRFAGTLSIGTLQGNLVNDLFASDIRIADPTGRTVLAIDSLVARPRWLALFSEQLTFRSVTLIRPEATLHRAADSTWNVQRAFARPERSDTTGGAVAFSLADLRIVDGRVSTARAGAPPPAAEDAWLFDYSQARLEDINAHATVEWRPGDELIDLFTVSGTLPDQNLRVERLQAQVLGRPDRWTLNQVQLVTDSTDLTLDATLPRRSAWADAPGAMPVALDLDGRSINFNEMRRLVPRLPLANAATVAAQLSGSLDGLVVESVQVERGDARLRLEGTVTGLPDAADYELDLTAENLSRERVHSLAPTLPTDAVGAVGPVDLSVYARGVWTIAADAPDLQTDIELAAQSDAGAVTGRLAVARSPDAPLEYAGTLRTDSLNLAPLLRRPQATSSLNGALRFSGRGLDRATSTAEWAVALTPSTLYGRQLDSLSAELHADQGHLEGALRLWHAGAGYLQADGGIDFQADRPTYTASVSMQRFNLNRLPFDRLPSTRLTARLNTRGSGLTPASLSGRLALDVDSSAVTYGGTTYSIPPHRNILVVADRSSSAPRVELSGDVATVRVQGDVVFEPLWALGNLWGRSLAAAARAELDKPYNRPLATTRPVTRPDERPSPAPSAAAVQARWRQAAADALRAAGFASALRIETTFSIQRSDVLEALLPVFPTLRTDLEGRLGITAGPDRMALESRLSGNRFAVRGLASDSVVVHLEATGSLQAPLAETFSADLDIRSTAARAGPLTLRAPHLAFTYTNRQALLRFDADENGRSGPFQLAASADLLPDRNELTLFDVHLTAGAYTWSTAAPSTIDAYADALVVPALRLQSRHPQTDRMQRIRLAGTFSARPSDTLAATFDGVLLQPFSDLAQFKRPLGGVVEGTLALAGGWTAPRTTSDLRVDWLSFDRRLLGTLSMTSRYELGAPDVLVDAALTPPPADSLTAPPDFLPYALRRTDPNRLTLSGRIRLPGAPSSSAALADRSRDALDLDLAVQRADLFFFEYIFEGLIENVSGHLTGDGQIQGSFRRPRFSADLMAVEGQFDLPRFNLQYALSGPIGVDAEGIKLDGVTVRGPDEGEATVSGAILFNEYAYFSFDLAATLQEMRIIDVARSQDLPFYGTIAASGDVTLTGPLSGATLRTSNAQTTPDSEIFIPVTESEVTDDSGFILFADSTGQLPDLRTVTRRDNILDERPEGEPSFLDALDLDINLQAPQGSTVNLVFDPLLGDVVTAVGTGRIQIQRQEGEFLTYGTLEVNSGEYLFTAGEVFVRRFLIDGGTITWDGNPTNAQLDLDASYRTRASTAGLAQNRQRQRIPVIIQLDITGRVASPRVGLSLAIDSRDRNTSFAGEALQSIFNQPDLATDDLATEYATSVLLTNTFLLTTSAVTSRQPTAGDTGDRLTDAGNQLAFNSVSQLVASQLNRYLSEALPNLDVNLGVQGEDPQDLDVIYGVALRLLDERLIIRGEGVYQGDEAQRRRTEGLEGEFIVEVRLSRHVSVEVFYRRTGDDLLNDQTLTSTTGAGLSYQTEFTTWRDFFRRLFEWFIPESTEDERP